MIVQIKRKKLAKKTGGRDSKLAPWQSWVRRRSFSSIFKRHLPRVELREKPREIIIKMMSWSLEILAFKALYLEIDDFSKKK